MKARRIPPGPLLLVALLVLLTVTCVGVLYGKFDYSELCAVCGRARHVVDWQIPRTERTYYSVREEKATSLSTVLEERQLVDTHEHQWQFVRGHGNGRTVVFGAGHPVSWSLFSPHAGGFMETMLLWTDRDTTLRWLNQLRDPAYSRMCQAMARASSGRMFQNRAEWEDWLRDFEQEHALMFNQSDPP